MAQSTPPAGVTIPRPPDTMSKPFLTHLSYPGSLNLPQLPAQPIQTPLLLAPHPQRRSQVPQPPEVTSPSARFWSKVDVLGSTVLRDQIAALTKSFENREVTFEDLIGLRSALLSSTLKRLHVTWRILLNESEALSGGRAIQVVEGELERIELSGLSRLQEQYVRSRIATAATKPLNRQRLEEALQLQLDPLLEQVNAELTVGSTPGAIFCR